MIHSLNSLKGELSDIGFRVQGVGSKLLKVGILGMI